MKFENVLLGEVVGSVVEMTNPCVQSVGRKEWLALFRWVDVIARDQCWDQ